MIIDLKFQDKTKKERAPANMESMRSISIPSKNVKYKYYQQSATAIKSVSTGERNLENRLGNLVNNPQCSDVTILIEGENVAFYAHRVFLTTDSRVMCQMLNNSNRKEDPIVITDITSDVMFEVLHYLYTYKTNNLNIGNVSAVMYAAQKYEIISLIEITLQYIIPKLNALNVCVFYEDSLVFDNDEIGKRCEQIISEETAEILQMDSFKAIGFEALTSILLLKSLAVDEVDLFMATMEWAKESCKKANKTIIDGTLRELLRNAENLIRFPTMSIVDFQKCTSKYPHFFNFDELGRIYMAITSSNVDGTPIGKFNSKKRKRYVKKG